LATSALVFELPIFPNRKYEIEVKHKTTMPDNIKYWQVFEDDKQVERFLQMSDEFANINIDGECCVVATKMGVQMHTIMMTLSRTR
jgi:hypothetical protein